MKEESSLLKLSELVTKVLSLFLGAIPIPADQPIMQIKDLDEVVIPTVELKVSSTCTDRLHLGRVSRMNTHRTEDLLLSLHQVDPSGCYDDLVTVRGFAPQYRLTGGINLPKTIDCVGSDGKSRKQLVKVGAAA